LPRVDSNPILPRRLWTRATLTWLRSGAISSRILICPSFGLPLNDYDRKTFYTFDFHGYTDYPFYDQQRDGLLSDPFCSQFHDSAFYFDSCLHAGLAQASAINSPRSESKNKALVLEAFDTLFNKRDYVAAERFWSPNYIQHSAHIAPGREGLFNLIKSIPPTLKYEPGMIVAEGDLVMIHGRFSGFGQPTAWIAADIVSSVILTEDALGVLENVEIGHYYEYA
jgi:predicted SnoaL-like aldol condensation-catalyzing enzyme